MISNHSFKSMRVNEKGDFTTKVLFKAKALAANDTNFQPHVADLEEKSTIFFKALEKFSLTDLTEQMRSADFMREDGIDKLKVLATACSKRSDPVLSLAGTKVLTTIKAVAWNPRSRGNAEETQLIDTLLQQFDTHPELVEAITTINGSEFLEETRSGQNLYKQLELQRTTLKSTMRKSDTAESARLLGMAIERVFQYINFQVELNEREEFRIVAEEINAFIADYKAKKKSRTTRSSSRRMEE